MGWNAEFDAIMNRQDGIIKVDEPVMPELAGPSGKVTKTGDTPWVLVDGIQWGQERIIYAPDGMPAVQIRLKAPMGVDADTTQFNRVLARFLPDGSIREVLIDFTPPYLESQDWNGSVVEPPAKPCEKCAKTKAILEG